MAGTTRVTALGRIWDGLVATVEAGVLRVAAIYADGLWTVTASGAEGRQSGSTSGR